MILALNAEAKLNSGSIAFQKVECDESMVQWFLSGGSHRSTCVCMHVLWSH